MAQTLLMNDLLVVSWERGPAMGTRGVVEGSGELQGEREGSGAWWARKAPGAQPPSQGAARRGWEGPLRGDLPSGLRIVVEPAPDRGRIEDAGER